MILGTAGHIDHGKTALVRALTGVDTDRLPEEKRRGITIDLGFAPLELPDGSVIGVVDVPGHEAFVRTMLAGASGIDLALLVIAADEGTMPQTREHLAILRLLDVPRLIVALTKVDLVEADWLQLVREETRALLAATSYADAEIVETSAVTGAGIEALRAAISAAASRSSRGSSDDLFRMPVDRAFTVKGTGTVATGTVWSGALRVDDTVRILPAGITARVRALQSHGASLAGTAPGIRAAVALAGIDKDEVGRGATLVSDLSWQPTLVLRADVTLLPDAPELRPRTRVRFHLATMDVSARVVAPGGPVQPGEQRAVRVVLDEPIVARSGDRFVLRSPSPLATIGGGVVTDANAPRRARTMVPRSLPLAQRLKLFVEEAGMHGVPTSSLGVRLGVAPGAAAELVNGSLRRVGDRLFSGAVLDSAREKLLRAVRSFHQQHPMETGASREEIRSRLGIDQALFDELVRSLAAERHLEADGSQLRSPGRSAQLTADQARVSSEVLGVVQSAGREPPSVAELEQRFGRETLSILKHLERQGRTVQVEDGRFYATEALSDLLARLEQGMAGKGSMAPTQLRELLGFSRKFLIPFLEYCDRKGYTVREGNGRVWKGRAKT